jgi:hypothetical protein
MIVYVLCAAGIIVALVAGIPLMERLLHWIKPLTPEQQERRRFLEEARRSIDRFRR